MFGRFTGGYYYTTNAAASVGLQLPGGGTSWNVVSDARLKNVHGPLTGALEALDQMRVVRYNYKCDEEDDEVRLGMIAQEVNGAYETLGLRKHYSEAHPYNAEHPDEEKIQTVSGDEMAYLALACMKELKEEIEVLRAENAELKSRLDKHASVIKRLNDDVGGIKDDVGGIKDDVATIKKTLVE
jgi:uncharacterized protein YdcH (DUF465 family)